MSDLSDWEIGKVEIVNTTHINIIREKTYIPTRKSCPKCKYDGHRTKNGIKWEKFYWAEKKMGEIVLTCRKCQSVLKRPF